MTTPAKKATPSKGGRPKMTPEQKEEAKRKREAAKEQAQFDRAFRKLPDEATSSAELTWIRNHPAMGLKDRQQGADKLNRIVLTAAHIKDSPSKAAVLSLQHWVNNPGDFHKQIISEQKKTAKPGEDDPGKGGDDEDSPEIKAIDELLMGLTGAVSPEKTSELEVLTKGDSA